MMMIWAVLQMMTARIEKIQSDRNRSGVYCNRRIVLVYVVVCVWVARNSNGVGDVTRNNDFVILFLYTSPPSESTCCCVVDIFF